jgi:hypothetical protein
MFFEQNPNLGKDTTLAPTDTLELSFMGNDCDARDEVLVAAQLRFIGDFDPNDIFLAGYPKSGNTWVQYLLAGLVFGVSPRLVPDSLVLHLVPDVHSRRFYTRHLTPTFFKTHDLPRPEYRKVIYLVRDGRDVMVSYFHHLTALSGPQDYMKLVIGDRLFPCRWHEHVEAWLANPHRAEMITIRYENLKKNTVHELKRICDFAGLKRERSLLRYVARNTTFDRMREHERKMGWLNAAWPKDKAFIRRGKVGSYKDEMPAEVLAAFQRLSMLTLKRLGY